MGLESVREKQTQTQRAHARARERERWRERKRKRRRREGGGGELYSQKCSSKRASIVAEDHGTKRRQVQEDQEERALPPDQNKSPVLSPCKILNNLHLLLLLLLLSFSLKHTPAGVRRRHETANWTYLLRLIKSLSSTPPPPPPKLSAHAGCRKLLHTHVFKFHA